MPGRLRIFAIYNPANVAKVVAGVHEEIRTAPPRRRHHAELNQARTGLIQRQQVQRSNDRTLIALLADDLYVGRTMQYQADLEQKIGDLNTEAVNAALRKYLDPENSPSSLRAISRSRSRLGPANRWPGSVRVDPSGRDRRRSPLLQGTLSNAASTRFLKQTGAAAVAAAVTGPFVHASDKSGTGKAIVGEGDYRYECHHNWGEVPARSTGSRRTAWRSTRTDSSTSSIAPGPEARKPDGPRTRSSSSTRRASSSARSARSSTAAVTASTSARRTARSSCISAACSR